MDLGALGERIAGEHLAARGHRVLDRRFRTRDGEIDLIVEIDGTVVFVEVKTRRGVAPGPISESIGPRKIAALVRTALRYLQDRGWLDRPTRFDVVEIRLGPGSEVEIRHLADAFRPTS